MEEMFRKPLGMIRQGKDGKCRVKLRGLYSGEGIQKWLVLIFESFGVMTERGILGKGTEVRNGTGMRGMIERYR